MSIFKELLDDINFAVVKDEVLEDEANVELFTEYVTNWQELLDTIGKENGFIYQSNETNRKV